MVALSSTEAEYIAMGQGRCLATRVAESSSARLFRFAFAATIRPRLRSWKTTRTPPAPATTRLATITSEKLVKDNQLKVEWISTHEQAADLLTKALDRIELQQHVQGRRRSLGLRGRLSLCAE